MALQLQDVLITAQLAARPRKARNLDAVENALAAIARAMRRNPEPVIQTLCDKALELCNAGSSGVSVVFEDENGGGFRWTWLAGLLAPFAGGSSAREHSPCGVCLRLGAAQLYSYPERYFEFLQATGLPVVEGLVIPLYGESGAPYGTIWVMKHEPGAGFDAEDVRTMTALGSHLSAALTMLGYFDS